MPTSFEAAAELMYPEVGEAVLGGLCMTGGQIVGIAMILPLQALCSSGHATVALILAACGIGSGLAAISFFHDDAIGQRRRASETLRRSSSRMGRSSSPTC